MSYIVSLLTDEWRDGLMHECAAYRLLSDGGGSLQIARTVHEGVENVGVELQVHMIKYGAQVAALLSHDDTPFFVMAVCKRDPLASPVALDLYVNAPLFERDMHRIGTVPGEKAVVDMLTQAGRHNLLFKRVHSPAPDAADRPATKRARTSIAEPYHSKDELLQRMVTREHSNMHVGLPMFLTIPGSQYVFCLNEYAFVPHSYGAYETVQLSAGAVMGDRGTEKTDLVKQLIVRTRAEPAANKRMTPSFLRPVKATLLVVPTALVDQWHAALAPCCRVIVLLNKRMLHHATFADVVACDVVLVTHMFYVATMRKASSKHKARVCARAPLCEVAHQYCRLDWVFWKRVVFDEALHFYVMNRKACQNVVRGRVLWLLQGGGDVTSLDACALLDFMMHQTTFARLPCLNVSTLALECFLRATAVQPKNKVQVEVIATTLTEPEACAYNVLARARSTTEELVQVAAGDLSPMKKFMHPVQTWANALPVGSTILNNYIVSASDVEFVWSEGDDNEEEEQQDLVAEEEEVVVPDENALAVVVDGVQDGAGDAVDVQPDTSSQAGGEGERRRQLDEMLDDMVEATTDEMQERLEFFKRAATELDRGELEPACCSVCLTNTCDCLFVCGHMLCHECVVHLFLNSKKREVQELAQQGYVASDDGFIAQCPQCRWDLEPHEVFWRANVSAKNHKHLLLSTLLRRLVGENKSVLVLGSMPEVVVTLMQNMNDDGLPCKACTYSPVVCRQALAWFKASPGRVLFMYTDQLSGLKLPFVTHVVLLHPHVHGLVQQHVVHNAVLHCVNSGDSERTVHVHRLLAENTVEQETV